MKKEFDHWNISDRKNKVIIALEKIKELNLAKFNDKNLRGLTIEEKKFIIKNDCKVSFTQYNIIGKRVNYFLIIKRNNLGKKELFAITKKQALRPNEQDICKGCLNHEILLKFNLGEFNFSRFNFEKNNLGTRNEIYNVIIHLF